MPRGTKFYIKTVLAISLVLVLVGYAYYQSRNLRSGPQVTIETPADGSLVSTPLIDITGKTGNISEITLNGSPIFVDENGKFSEKRALLPGYNVFEIQVKDKFDRTATKDIALVYQSASDTPVIQ